MLCEIIVCLTFSGVLSVMTDVVLAMLGVTVLGFVEREPGAWAP